jgi:hypothetical protein
MEDQLSTHTAHAPVLTPAETYESPAQMLRRLQAETKNCADGALASLAQRIEVLSREAAELATIDTYASNTRAALGSFASAAAGAANAIQSKPPRIALQNA